MLEELLENLKETKNTMTNKKLRMLVNYFAVTYGKNNEIKVPISALEKIHEGEGGHIIWSLCDEDFVTVRYFTSDDEQKAFGEKLAEESKRRDKKLENESEKEDRKQKLKQIQDVLEKLKNLMD